MPEPLMLPGFGGATRMVPQDLPLPAGPRGMPLVPEAGDPGSSPGRGAAGLRPYQVEAVAAIQAQLAAVRSTLLVMATGGGKTVTFGAIAKDWPGRVLMLAHRTDLLEQARRTLRRLTGEYVGLEKAEAKAGGERIVVASVQTLKEGRLSRFERQPFGLVVIDEAHHATAKAYRRILAAFPGAKILGVTATPDRTDREQLGQVFDSVAYRKDMHDLIADAWLTPEWMRPAIKIDVNLDKLSTRRGDFADGEMDDAISEAVAPIAHALLEKAGERRSLTFTPGVKTAHAAAEALNKLRPGCARAIDGSMDEDLRKNIKEAHRNGDFAHLINCQLLVEGYDDPSLLVGMLARPTKSRLIHAQQVGRLLRLWPGVEEIDDDDERRVAIAASPKPRAELLDLACNSSRHELASPIDLLGGKITDQERRVAKKILREEGGDPRKALEAAREEIRSSAARAARSKTKVEFGEVNDPFVTLGARNPERRLRILRPEDFATDRMLAMLRNRGIDVPERCTRRQFRVLLGAHRKRRQQGLIAAPAVKWLAAFGIDGRNFTKDVYGAITSAYRANGKFMPGPDVIQRIIGARTVGMEG